jgi:hypothetical protein
VQAERGPVVLSFVAPSVCLGPLQTAAALRPDLPGMLHRRLVRDSVLAEAAGNSIDFVRLASAASDIPASSWRKSSNCASSGRSGSTAFTWKFYQVLLLFALCDTLFPMALRECR